MNSKILGAIGEKIAEKFLKRKGYKILDKNYSNKFISGPQTGEIDVIVKKDDVIIFVEVKTLRQAQGRPFRQGLRLNSAECPQGENFLPEDKVDFIKQRKLMKTAESWLMKNKISLDTRWQIDVIAIELDSDNKKAKIRHFENAVF